MSNETLKSQIQKEIVVSLKAKEEIKTTVLKGLMSSIVNKEIELGKREDGLNEEEVVQVVKSEAKKRKDAIEAYSQADREELANKEREELEILQTYLPAEIPDEEIEKVISEVIKKTEASSMKDFGLVMKESMAKLKGKASGDRVSALLKQTLGSES